MSSRGGSSSRGSRPQEPRARGPASGGIRFFPHEHYVLNGAGQLPVNYAMGAVPTPQYTDYSTDGIEATVAWVCNVDPNRENVTKDAFVARRAALEAGGFRYVVIRAREHNMMNKRNKAGQRVTTSRRLTHTGAMAQVTTPSDWHMTVVMGNSPQSLFIQGHVFLYPYDQGHPCPGHYMDRPQDWRQYAQNAFERTQSYEYWTLRGVTIAHKQDGEVVLPE